MVPSITLDCNAADGVANVGYVTKEQLLDDKDSAENDQSERGWWRMRSDDAVNAFKSNNYCRPDQRTADDEGCNRLRFAMSIWMVLVRRPDGDLQTKKDHETR